MRPIKTFRIGSSVFFKDYFPRYVEKDTDELNIMDTFIPKGNVVNLKDGTKDVFFFRDMDKDGFIDDALSCKVPMRAGKFLVPEFAEYLGMTVDDLTLLSRLFYSMDDRHTYERIIYESYMENGNFTLTDEQRERAFSEYMRKRPETYGKK